MSCGVGHRRGSDPMLQWLWCRPAATAPIQPLAWETPYAMGVALKRQKTKKKKKKRLTIIHSCIKPLLCVCYVLGSVIAAGNAKINRI